MDAFYHSLDPVAFRIGDFTVRWYGIAYILGFACASVVLVLVARRWKIHIEEDRLLAGILCGIAGIIIGARLGYVLFYGNGYYWSNPMKIFAIYEGGMSFHGGFIGGIVGGFFGAKLMKIKFLRLLDLAFIGVPIGLFFGRCANFINGEL